MENALARTVGGYIVRNCSKEDLSTVTKVNMASLPEHYSDYFYEELLRENLESFLVAEKDGKVVGYIMCRTEYGFSYLKKFGLARKGHIVSVAVIEEHRSRGLGTVIVQEALKALKKRGCTEAFLEVRISNKLAIKLYERLSFNIVSTIPMYYRDGESAHVMSVKLE